MTTFLRSTSCALALLTACAGDELAADPPRLHDLDRAPAVIRAAAQAVVRIQHPSGSSATGSFLSADGLLLTNEHVLGGHACARDGCTLRLTFNHQRGEPWSASREVYAIPQHVDVGLDMALVQVFADEARTQRLDTPSFLVLDPRSAEQLVGQHVTAIGHPLGRLKKWSDGFVIDAGGDWFDTSIFSLPGGSGSPMVDDAGRLVGLLHRGAEGFDLLTSNSTQVAAVASASASLQAALAAPLPASVSSLSEDYSVDALLDRTAAFLAGSKWTANVAGQEVSLVSVLADECDRGLARDDYGSLEDLRASLSPCFTALDFIECRGDTFEQVKTSPKPCPEFWDRVAWLQRLHAVADKQREFNGGLDLSSIASATEVLAASQLEAERASRLNILAALDAARPKLDFTIAAYLAAYDIESYDGQNTRDFFVNYARVPFYQRYAWQICSSALWLYSVDQLKRDQALGIAWALYRDDDVSLGAKLRIEDVLYNADQL